MNPKVSIILPIYNTAEMLRQCLGSIKDQSFVDFEVLMVDDGSKDHSECICRDFASGDPRFHYIKKENGGKSSAVNLGYTKAKGEFICIFDSDDFIESDLLKIVVNIAEEEQVDVVNFGYYYKKGEQLSKRDTLFPKNRVLSRQDFIDLLKQDAPKKSRFLWFTWTNLFRKSLLDQHHILHELDLGVSADSIFNLECYLNAQGIYAIDDPLYFYVYHPQSLSQRRYKPNLIEEVQLQFDKKMETLQKYEINDRGVFTDVARYYVEHSLFLLIVNEKHSETGLKSQKLKEFRTRDVYARCFPMYQSSRLLPSKKSVIARLFQYRLFGAIVLIHKLFGQ